MVPSSRSTTSQCWSTLGSCSFVWLSLLWSLALQEEWDKPRRKMRKGKRERGKRARITRSNAACWQAAAGSCALSGGTLYTTVNAGDAGSHHQQIRGFLGSEIVQEALCNPNSANALLPACLLQPVCPSSVQHVCMQSVDHFSCCRANTSVTPELSVCYNLQVLVSPVCYL